MGARELTPNTIKLLAIDLDGTLLNSRHQISQRNKAALLRAMDQGHCGRHRHGQDTGRGGCG